MELEEAVELCLRNWAGLTLALNHLNRPFPWALKQELVSMITNYSVDQRDVYEFLEEYMDVQFSVDLEDDSTQDIAGMLIAVYEESRNNRTDTLEQLRRLARTPRQDPAIQTVTAGLAQLGLQTEPPVLVQDQDGFEEVKAKKKRNRKR